MTKRSAIGLVVFVAIAFVTGLLISRHSSRKRDIVVFNNSPIVDAALYDTTSGYYVDFESVGNDIRLLPIVVMTEDTTAWSALDTFNNLDLFDNITGAFSSDAIVDFAGEKFIFFADMAGSPYNEYESREALRDVILKDVVSLLQDKATMPKIFVIDDPLGADASFKEIKSFLQQSESGIKVISVVESATDYLFDHIDTVGITSFAIGIVGSGEVIESECFQKALKEEILNRGITCDIQIIPQIYSADTTQLRYFDEETGYSVKNNVTVSAIDSIYSKRKVLDNGYQNELSAIIVTDTEYYRVVSEYAEAAGVTCPLIFPEQCAAIKCYETLRFDSNLSLRIVKKSQQIYFSVADDDGTTQNVCINQL